MTCSLPGDPLSPAHPERGCTCAWRVHACLTHPCALPRARTLIVQGRKGRLSSVRRTKAHAQPRLPLWGAPPSAAAPLSPDTPADMRRPGLATARRPSDPCLSSGSAVVSVTSGCAAGTPERGEGRVTPQRRVELQLWRLTSEAGRPEAPLLGAWTPSPPHVLTWSLRVSVLIPPPPEDTVPRDRGRHGDLISP